MSNDPAEAAGSCLRELHSFADEARASIVYANAVVGGFASSTPNDPLTTLGAPDGQIIQMTGEGSGTLTLDFGVLFNTPGTLSVFTYDLPFPAAAKVEVSSEINTDTTTFVLVSPLILDTNGPIGPPYPYIDLPVSSPFRYVRFTSLVGPNNEPHGFDLDAVGFTASEVAAVPEPATLTLWTLGTLGCAIAGYRRRKAA